MLKINILEYNEQLENGQKSKSKQRNLHNFRGFRKLIDMIDLKFVAVVCN
jgi:hypothetical protein